MKIYMHKDKKIQNLKKKKKTKKKTKKKQQRPYYYINIFSADKKKNASTFNYLDVFTDAHIC